MPLYLLPLQARDALAAGEIRWEDYGRTWVIRALPLPEIRPYDYDHTGKAPFD